MARDNYSYKKHQKELAKKKKNEEKKQKKLDKKTKGLSCGGSEDASSENGIIV